MINIVIIPENRMIFLIESIHVKHMREQACDLWCLTQYSTDKHETAAQLSSDKTLRFPMVHKKQTTL